MDSSLQTHVLAYWVRQRRPVRGACVRRRRALQDILRDNVTRVFGLLL